MLTKSLQRLRQAFPTSGWAILLPVVLALGIWAYHPAPQQGMTHSGATLSTQSDPGAWSIDARRDGPPPDDRRGREDRDGGRHHGPPPVPPTVLFLTGAALGYLIGTRRRGGRCHKGGCGCCCRQQSPSSAPAQGITEA